MTIWLSPALTTEIRSICRRWALSQSALVDGVIQVALDENDRPSEEATGVAGPLSRSDPGLTHPGPARKCCSHNLPEEKSRPWEGWEPG